MVPYIYTSDSSDDALLQFVVYITTPQWQWHCGDFARRLKPRSVRHSLRGIETLARFGNRGLVIEIVTIEADEDPLTVVGEYKRRSFLIERLQQAEFSQELSDFEQTYTMMVTVATNALSLWMDITFSDDRSDLPPTPLFFEQPGDDGQPTSVALSWVRQVEALTRRAELFLSIPDVGYSEPIESKESKYVYDQGFGSSLNTQDELPLMIWVEADQPRRDDASRTTRIRFAPILEGNDDSQRLLELGAETYASPDIDAQRISIAAGTRSTGVLAHGSDATRFFAIVDGKPVCRLLPPPSP